MATIKKIDRDIMPPGSGPYLAALFDESGAIEVFTKDHDMWMRMNAPSNQRAREHADAAAGPDHCGDGEWRWVTSGRIFDLLGVLEEYSVVYGEQAGRLRRLLNLWIEADTLGFKVDEYSEERQLTLGG